MCVVVSGSPLKGCIRECGQPLDFTTAIREGNTTKQVHIVLSLAESFTRRMWWRTSYFLTLLVTNTARCVTSSACVTWCIARQQEGDGEHPIMQPCWLQVCRATLCYQQRLLSDNIFLRCWRAERCRSADPDIMQRLALCRHYVTADPPACVGRCRGHVSRIWVVRFPTGTECRILRID